MEKLAALLTGNTVAGKIDFANAAKQDQATLAKQIEAWVMTF